MKKLVFGLSVCCMVMTFAISYTTTSFAAVMDEVVLDASSDGVLGYFDIEVKVKSPGGLSLGAHDPEIIAVVKREIVKLGGACDRSEDKRPGNIIWHYIAHITGTVVE